MATPDVRVRLSAEGVQEVVDALRRIQAEAQRTAAASSKSAAVGKSGFDGFGKAVAGVANVYKALGTLVAVGTVLELSRQSIDAADAVTKLRERLGGTVSDLSALAVAARLSRSSLSAVEVALGTLGKRVADLRTGDATAAELFGRIGLSARSFKGLALPQQLELVARGLQRIADDGDRAALAQAILGKNVRELLPMLGELGRSGLKGLQDQAKSLGLLVDPRVVQQAARFGDSMGVLNQQVQAVVTTFVGGFATGVVGVLDDYERSLGTAISAAETFGRVVGQVPRTVYGMLKVILAPIAALFARLTVDAMAVWDAANLAMRGHFAEALSRGKLLEQQRRAINDRALRDIADGWKIATTIPKRPGAGSASDVVSDSDLQEAFQRRAEAMRSALENEKRIHDAQFALRERSEESSYQRSLTSIRDHYAARRKLVQDSLAWEIAALVRQRAITAANPDRETGQRDARGIDAQIRARKIQAQVSFADLADREIADVRKAAETRLSWERKILDATGNRFAATVRGIEEEQRRYADDLRLQGLATDEIARRVQVFGQAMQAAATFEEARNEADTVMARFTSERARIQSDIDAGVLTQLQGENRILALERERLPGLQEMADALERAAAATGDSERIAQAQQFADGLRNVGRAANVAEQSMQRLRAGFEDALRGGLTEFFTTGINQATSFGGAMQSMAASVVSALQRIAGEALALQITNFLGFASGGQVRKNNPRAAGGLISGPGTGTSDSIPAWVSAGEYIVRAAAVAAPGMVQHLDAINRGMRPISIEPFRPARFADGGLVAGAALTAGSPVGGQVQISIDDGLVARIVESPEFQRGSLKVIGKNPRAVRGMLG